jgi:hypothetical protein
VDKIAQRVVNNRSASHRMRGFDTLHPQPSTQPAGVAAPAME